MSAGDESATVATCVPQKQLSFAHASEAEFASILDFYEIEWEYEPKTFPLRWHADGQIKQCFTPDFYLPEFGLYVELTTLRQKLVTKKNAKLRRLRELYPDVRIKLFYGKDIRSLLTKYGVADEAGHGGVQGVGVTSAALPGWVRGEKEKISPE